MGLHLHPCREQSLIAIGMTCQRNATCSSSLFLNVSGGKQGIQKIEEE